MSANSRLFGWNVTVLQINADAVNQGAATTLLDNLVALFTECRLVTDMHDIDGRAIGEFGGYPLVYAYDWSIEIGQVIDGGFNTSPISFFIQFGPGPFWVQLSNADGATYTGRVVVGHIEHDFPDGPQHGRMTLKGVGVLSPSPLVSVTGNRAPSRTSPVAPPIPISARLPGGLPGRPTVMRRR